MPLNVSPVSGCNEPIEMKPIPQLDVLPSSSSVELPDYQRQLNWANLASRRPADDKHRLGGKLVLQTHRFFGSTNAVFAGTRGIDIARLEKSSGNTPPLMSGLRAQHWLFSATNGLGFLKARIMSWSSRRLYWLHVGAGKIPDIQRKHAVVLRRWCIQHW